MQETIGQRLKREREARYLSVEKAAEETRIRKVFIHALEADDYSVIPSAAQGRGFLRNYAEYLGLNIDELVVELQRNPIGPAEEEMSGPLPQLNLVETEIPPLTDAPIEETISPFLGRILRRPKNSEKQPLIGYGVNVDSQDKFKQYDQDIKKMQTHTKSFQDDIYASVALDQYLEDYEQKERQAFVDAFIENARRGGYDVELNDNLEVVGVRPIRNGFNNN